MCNKAYNLIKKVVGRDRFYNNLRDFIELSKRSCKDIYILDKKYNHKIKRYENYVYSACNCYLIEFEIDGSLFSYYIDSLLNRSFELTNEMVQEMRITNSLKYKLNK